LNILIVEDDAELAQLLAQGLREEAYTVDIARDGVALELSRACSFDVILLDVMLPGISGLDVARQLRCRLLAKRKRLTVSGPRTTSCKCCPLM
jgi:DNA-binding response OmpR family regulator